MEKTWRWFGKKDKITLSMLRQIGVEGIVTALHDIPNGEIWTYEAVAEMRDYIAAAGLRWSVVESLPVSESIKYGGPDRDQLIENYIASLANLGKAGIKTICYNFMPVLDWARTDLENPNPDGTSSLYFDRADFAYFDCCILKREGAEKDYDADIMEQEIHWNFLARTDDFVHTEMYGDCRAERSYNPVELLDPECFEYMKNKLAGYYREYGIRRFKFDLYQLTAFNTIRGDAQLHYEAYRRLIEELRQEIPELILSMDSTRRNRPAFDFSLDFGRIFLENRGRAIPDHRYYHPWRALANFHQTAQFVPAHRIELEMMPHAMDYPLEYILGTVLFATPLYWGLIANCPPERRAGMKRFFAAARQLREELANSLVIPLGEAPEDGSWSVILAVPRGEGRTFLALYRNGAAEPEYRFTGTAGLRRAERLLGNGTVELDSTAFRFRETEPYAFSLYTVS